MVMQAIQETVKIRMRERITSIINKVYIYIPELSHYT